MPILYIELFSVIYFGCLLRCISCEEQLRERYLFGDKHALMREPYKKISIPESSQNQRTLLLPHQNLVSNRTFNAARKQSIKIDNQDYTTLTLSKEKSYTIRVYHVPKEGKSAMILFHFI